MRVSYNWLKDYVDFDLAPVALAEKLTMAGIAVENIEYLAEGITNVVIGQITEVKPHPHADKLVVCLINAGKYGDKIQIVTGAPNVKAGLFVPLALVGATLPGGVEIDAANFRGVTSEGMLCSAEELSLDPSLIAPEQREGILVLDEEAVPGTSVTGFLGLDDYVLELELTPNRSDCLSMINVAREVAAITRGSLYFPQMDAGQMSEKISFEVKIQEEELCSRYVALIIEDIILQPSPRWMQQRLITAGMRPINNIVDVTNYVMLEMGQPLHAFDLNTLVNNQIIVRRAREDEKIITLDGVERKLDPEMLVIADFERPIAIAGVMGGLETEVTGSTRTILLESAHFDNASIRRTSRRLGLRSEASSRFEKGVNRAGALETALRASQLIKQLKAGGGLTGKIDVYPNPWVQEKITIRTEKTNDLLGTEISTDLIKDLLLRLQLEIVKEDAQELTVAIPSYRSDLTREIDLIEEVARLFGYNKIPTVLPKSEMEPDRRSKIQLLEADCKEILINHGLTEVINFGFINQRSLNQLNLPEDHPWRNTLKLLNPLSEEQSVMRTTLIPGILETAFKNFSRRINDLAIFEIGRVYHPSGEIRSLPEEKLMLTALVSGEYNSGWNWQGIPMDYYYLKGIVEALIKKSTRIEPRFKPLTDHSVYHPGRSAQILLNNKIMGEIGELHPNLKDNFQSNQRLYIFNLDLTEMEQYHGKIIRYQPLAKFPAVERDMAVLISEEISSEAIGRIIKKVGGGLIKKFELFDVYKGKQIKEGAKSLAYSITYQAADRTLTDEEVNELHDKIKQSLQGELGVEFR